MNAIGLPCGKRNIRDDPVLGESLILRVRDLKKLLLEFRNISLLFYKSVV